MGVMKTREFYSYEDLACDIVKDMQDIECSIDIVCFYEDARAMIRELVLTGACTIGNIDISEESWNGYNKEYYVSVSKAIDNEWSVWCEPAIRKGTTEYIPCEADVCYVLDDCNSRVLRVMKSPIVFETHIIEKDMDAEEGICMCPACQAERMMEEQCCDCCDDFDCDNECDDEMDCITYSSNDGDGFYSISFYSNDKNRMKEMAEVFRKIRD